MKAYVVMVNVLNVLTSALMKKNRKNVNFMKAKVTIDVLMQRMCVCGFMLHGRTLRQRFRG